MRPSGSRASLAKKISLLFGSAVLLTITATLAFPWRQMTALQEEVMLIDSKRAAGVALQLFDPLEPDWNSQQEVLDEQWPRIQAQLGLNCETPRLIPLGSAGEGFQADAIRRLTESPAPRYFWRLQREGNLFRLAMAVRGPQTSDHPDVLRGIIDVRIPVLRELNVWNWLVTVLAGASGAMLAILVFYVVTQRLVLAPVQSLRAVAERVTSGDTLVRATAQSRDEFRDLSDAFNDMLAHIKSAQDEQQKINRSLDIKLGELAETNVALYESSRVKSEFLANVTHELRTPLVSIIGFAELLRDITANPEVDRRRLARYAQNILTSGRSLLDLINDLLDLAKIEAGKLELHLSDFSIEELCRDLTDFVRPLADKQNQQLSLEVEPDLPHFRNDSGRIKQILYNLLSNAIKFTPTGGAISLTVANDVLGRVRMSVSDNGPGIAPEDRDRIFEKFRQLDSSTTREHPGTGLGLAITRELVEILSGVIDLQSEVGVGSTFTVRLPPVAPRAVERPRIKLA